MVYIQQVDEMHPVYIYFLLRIINLALARYVAIFYK